MSPKAIQEFLDKVVKGDIKTATMIWGPPGIGKSSVVAQVAESHGMELIDVRISQLGPQDLRGLPVPDFENDGATWWPPNFLPRDPRSRGILFLDEINMAPPVVQGIAQQLVLDRQMGDYVVPDGWFIWAAGNRKEDAAAVFEMSAPLSNRFIHVTMRPDFPSFLQYMAKVGFSEEIIGFLLGNEDLLHKMSKGTGAIPAWPSPRMWDQADLLFFGSMPIDPAVGPEAGKRFAAFLQASNSIRDPEDLVLKILSGDPKSNSIDFPSEDSSANRMLASLAMRSNTQEAANNAAAWMSSHARSVAIENYNAIASAAQSTKGLSPALARHPGSGRSSAEPIGSPEDSPAAKKPRAKKK